MKNLKNNLLIIFMVIAMASCKTNNEQEGVVFAADMETAMGWNYLRIYKDSSFEFEERKLLKKVVYKGKAERKADTIHFTYEGETPSFGDVAVIDSLFLTYINGTVYNELLEISLNEYEKLD